MKNLQVRFHTIQTKFYKASTLLTYLLLSVISKTDFQESGIIISVKFFLLEGSVDPVVKEMVVSDCVETIY